MLKLDFARISITDHCACDMRNLSIAIEQFARLPRPLDFGVRTLSVGRLIFELRIADGIVTFVSMRSLREDNPPPATDHEEEVDEEICKGCPYRRSSQNPSIAA